jgi:hypothetical protein
MDGVAAQTIDAGHGEAAGLADRVRLQLEFDPGPLQADLDRFGEAEWVRHVVRDNYEGAWTMIPLRAPAGETHPIRMCSTAPGAAGFVDTFFLDRAPALREALRRFRCPLRSARLMRLAPGSLIREHSDPFLDPESGWARLHVPIATNARVAFRLNRRTVAMEPGSCWYLRLSDPHQASNRGDSDRVHLVVDAVVNDWLAAMLAAGAAS